MVFTNLNSYLEIEDDIDEKNHFILISDENIDGNFLIHHFLSCYSKKNFNIFLLGLAQTQTHYSNAGQKLGVNIGNLVKEGRFQFIDGLELLFDGFNGEEIRKCLTCPSSSSSLSKLGEMIENAIVKAASSSGGTGNLFVIDDLTSLVNVGYTCQGIFDFVHHCKVISQRLNTSFLIMSHANVEDDDYTMLNSRLRDYATLHVNVQSLKTGYSRDLSGQMQICNFKNAYSTTKKTLHFKLADRDVRLFAPGTSTAVL